MDDHPALQLIRLSKAYGELKALDGVSFGVAEGEIVAVLGPSGSGKSTLLMAVAGLERLDGGDILWKGASLSGVPPHRRNFGLMFQDYVLFPHMNVFDNVAFGLRMAGMEEQVVRKRAMETLELVGLAAFTQRDPSTLSGGEQQRVALARSLAPQPRLLMLDEPLGSVDRTLRERLMVELRQILRRLHQTVLYVTHDQEEAFAIAERIVLLRAGRVEQVGTPQEIYRHPASLFTARFLGLTNLFPGAARRVDGRILVATPLGDLPVESAKSGRVVVLLRPDAVNLDGQGECQVQGEMVETTFLGNLCRAIVAFGETRLSFAFPSSVELPAEGQAVQLSFDPQEALQVFDETET